MLKAQLTTHAHTSEKTVEVICFHFTLLTNQELEQKFHQKLIAEGERYKELKDQKAEMEATYDDELKALKESHLYLH